MEAKKVDGYFCNGYNEVVVLAGQIGMKFGHKTSVGVLC